MHKKIYGNKLLLVGGLMYVYSIILSKNFNSINCFSDYNSIVNDTIHNLKTMSYITNSHNINNTIITLHAILFILFRFFKFILFLIVFAILYYKYILLYL